MLQSGQEESLGVEEAVLSAPSIIDALSGPQKAAAVLVAMGKEPASRLIKYFKPQDLRLLSGQAHALPDIHAPDFEKLVVQFEDAFAEGAALSSAGERFATLVQESLPEDEAAAVLDPQFAAALTTESIFEVLVRMSPEALSPVVAGENPQVAAFILSRLPSNLSAKVLLAQSPSTRAAIVQRSLRLLPVPALCEEILGQALRVALANPISAEKKSQYKQIANMLNQLDKDEMDDVFASLSDMSEQDLNHIRSLLFAFEDIVRLDARARLLLFDGINADIIIRALRGADEKLVGMVLESLSQRTRRMVEAELSSEGEQVSQDDIIAARRDIAQTALELAERGTISIEADA